MKFTPLFFEKHTNQLTDEEKLQLTEKLTMLYGGAPVTYLDSSHFCVCKIQLLTLLDYIVALAPQKLQIFERYRTRVAEMPETHPSTIDIKITLKAAKERLEQALLSIESGYMQVDSTKLDSYLVEYCYTGAFSNIEIALSHFQLNANCISLFLEFIKSSMLTTAAQNFLQTAKLDRLPGQEIHDINTLYNYIAHRYGLDIRDEKFISMDFSEEILNNFSKYLIKHMSTRQLITQCLLHIEPPPKIIISSSDNGDNFQKLDNFFRSVGRETNRVDYLKFYDEFEDNDGNVTLQPQTNFELFHSYFLTMLLEEKGYIANSSFTHNGTSYQSNGTTIVRLSNDRYYILTDPEIIYLRGKIKSIYEGESDSYSFYNSNLMMQLSVPMLYELYRQHQADRSSTNSNEWIVVYFSLLLGKNMLLALDIVNGLIGDMKNRLLAAEQESEFIDHLFMHNYKITGIEIDTLFDYFKISEATRKRYFNYTLQNDFHHHIPLFVKIYKDIFKSALVFHAPSYYGSHRVLRELIKISKEIHHNNPTETVDISVADKDGQTAAHLAAMRGHLQVLKILQENQADIFAENTKGETPLHLAIQNGHVAIVEYLITIIPNLANDCQNSEGIIHLAARFGQIKIIELLQRVAPELLNIVTEKNENAMHIAVAAQQSAVIVLLHKLCPTMFSEVDQDGFTPAMLIAANGNVPLLMLLNQNGIPLNTPNLEGMTPAHIAALSGQLDVIKYFRSLGTIDLMAEAVDGATPASLAIEIGKIDVLRLLYDCGVDFSRVNSKGTTLVHIATELQLYDIITLLHSYKVDLTTKNFNGLMAIDIAKNNNWREGVDLLKSLISNNNVSKSGLFVGRKRALPECDHEELAYKK